MTFCSKDINKSYLGLQVVVQFVDAVVVKVVGHLVVVVVGHLVEVVVGLVVLFALLLVVVVGHQQYLYQYLSQNLQKLSLTRIKFGTL